MSSESIKVALLVDSMKVPEWQYQLVQRVINTRRIHLQLVITHISSSAKQYSTALFRTRINRGLLRTGLRILKIVDRLGAHAPPDPLRLRSLQTLCQPDVVCQLQDKELADRYSELAVDVLLVLGQHADLPDSLYRGSQYGAWYLFSGALHNDCDLWTGLREHVANADQLYAGVVSYQSKSAILADKSVEQTGGDFQGQCLLLSSNSIHSAFLHRAVEPMLWKMAGLLPQLLQQLRDAEFPEVLLAAKRERYSARIKALALPAQLPVSGWGLLIKCMLAGLWSKAKLLSAKMSGREKWVLLYGEQDFQQRRGAFVQSTQLASLQRLTPPSGAFWADPQLVIYQQRRFIFFEECIEAQNKGRIACLEWYGGDQFSRSMPVLEEAFHLSYPHVFTFGGQYYMVPESAENKTIALYRCVRFPERWEFVHNLMEEIEAYDATLCEHQGRWWLFVNIRQHPYSSPDDLLYLYSADSPLSQQWLSHPANPIVSEVSSARSAGRIMCLGGKLYRPSQNCAGSYGRGLNLNQIVRWNSKNYQEYTVGHFVPDGAAGLYGIHTFSMLGYSIVSDGIVRQTWRNQKSWQWLNNKK